MEQNNNQKRTFWQIFYITFLMVFIFAFIILFTISVNKREAAFEELTEDQNKIVIMESDKITREFTHVLSDLKYLNNAFKDEIIDPLEYSNVASNWKEFSNQRGIYDQIRFMDIDGNEKIRINRNADGSYIVSDKNLQNKADRYYFKKTIALENGDFYISPMDLNIESDEIEVPYKPVIRLSTPLYDDDGNKKGIVIVNYLASDLLSLIKTAAIGSEGSLSLLNNDGYYLLDVDKSKEWGFMFEDSQDMNFIKNFPLEWPDLSSGVNQVISENGIFFSHKLNLEYVFVGNVNSQVVIENDFWFLVSFVPRNDDNSYYFTDNKIAMFFDIIKSNAIAFIFAIFLSILVGIIVFFNNRYYSKIKYFSQYDSLTKAYNRGYGLSQLEKVIHSDNKKDLSLCLCYIDINGLKEVNDNLGHKQGSILIKHVVESVIDIIAIDDFIIRLGGDEFLIILKGKNENQAEIMWQSIVEAYNRINNEKNFDFIISVSHGIIELDKKNKTKTHDVLHNVDQKMYVEKKLIKSKLTTVLK